MMSIIDIPLHDVTHVLQQADERAATHETDESIEVIESATVVNSGTTERTRKGER